MISPAANTPGKFVSIVSKSTLIVPHLLTFKFLFLKRFGRSSGSNPRAFITISAFKLNSELVSMIGFLLPLSSGFPSFILSTKIFSFLG